MKKFYFWIPLAISFLALGAAQAQEKIRVGLGSISLQSGLVYIAKDRGIFTKYGLTAESIYIPGGSTNGQGFISGHLEMLQFSGAPGVAVQLAIAGNAFIARPPD